MNGLSMLCSFTQSVIHKQRGLFICEHHEETRSENSFTTNYIDLKVAAVSKRIVYYILWSAPIAERERE